MTPYSLNNDKCNGMVSGIVTIPASSQHKVEVSEGSLDGWKADQYVILVVRKLLDSTTKKATSDQSGNMMTAVNMDNLNYATCKFIE